MSTVDDIDEPAVEAAPIPTDAAVPQHPSVTDAPLPTARTRRRRHNLVVQGLRFVSLNIRMAMLAMRGHK
ncbi:MAG: hypothetical protein KDC46_07135 [Thermoleophilia bacterium]|nr:hypothetical protein [Thermoleophilia bacterium]